MDQYFEAQQSYWKIISISIKFPPKIGGPFEERNLFSSKVKSTAYLRWGRPHQLWKKCLLYTSSLKGLVFVQIYFQSVDAAGGAGPSSCL